MYASNSSAHILARPVDELTWLAIVDACHALCRVSHASRAASNALKAGPRYVSSCRWTWKGRVVEGRGYITLDQAQEDIIFNLKKTLGRLKQVNREHLIGDVKYSLFLWLAST